MAIFLFPQVLLIIDWLCECTASPPMVQSKVTATGGLRPERCRKIIKKGCKYKIIMYICERMSVLHHIQYTV